jgi:hypothetical protein
MLNVHSNVNDFMKIDKRFAQKIVDAWITFNIFFIQVCSLPTLPTKQIAHTWGKKEREIPRKIHPQMLCILLHTSITVDLEGGRKTKKKYCVCVCVHKTKSNFLPQHETYTRAWKYKTAGTASRIIFFVCDR